MQRQIVEAEEASKFICPLMSRTVPTQVAGDAPVHAEWFPVMCEGPACMLWADAGRNRGTCGAHL